MLISNTPPERLTIHDCTINDSNIKELQQTFTQTDVTEVCFQACHIVPKEINLFTTILSQKNITTFSVNNSCVFPSGMKEIIDYIIANKNLRSLDLSYMRMGSENLTTLLRGIKNHPLSLLDLSGNIIGKNEAVLLKEFLQNNTTIKELNLFKVHLTDGGMRSIAEALKNNSSLTTLMVRDNCMTVTSEHPIVKLIYSNNPNLTSVNLTLNRITQGGAVELVEALKANTHICFFKLSKSRKWPEETKQKVATIEQTLSSRKSLTG